MANAAIRVSDDMLEASSRHELLETMGVVGRAKPLDTSSFREERVRAHAYADAERQMTSLRGYRATAPHDVERARAMLKAREVDYQRALRQRRVRTLKARVDEHQAWCALSEARDAWIRALAHEERRSRR